MQTLKVILTVLVVTVTALAAANPARAYNSTTLAPELHPLVAEELTRRLMNQYARVPFGYWYPSDHATVGGSGSLSRRSSGAGGGSTPSLGSRPGICPTGTQ